MPEIGPCYDAYWNGHSKRRCRSGPGREPKAGASTASPPAETRCKHTGVLVGQ